MRASGARRTRAPAAADGAAPTVPRRPAAAGRRGAEAPLTVAALATFLRNPVKDYFRRRLNVVFDDDEEAVDDDEPFALAGLGEYGLLQRR